MSIDPQGDPLDPQDSRIERKLVELYRLPALDAGFADRLEAKLADRKVRPNRSPRWRLAWNWALGAAGFVLLVAFIVAAFSVLPRPQSALPQVEPAQSAEVQPTGTQTPTADLLAGEILPAATAGPLRYKVAAGDTCAVIAYSFGVSVESIINYNRLDPACTELTAGQELLIPQPTASARFTPAPSPTPLSYTIQAGDTLYSIAQRYGVSAASLFELNGIQTGDILLPGSKLLIPVQVVPTLEPGAAPYVLSRMGSEKANLRAGPGTQFEVVGAFGGNESLTINTSQPRGEWIPVDYPAAPGGIAWVWSQIVTVVDAAETVGTPPAADQVRASNPRLDGDALLVDVCFELPDGRDWMVRDALLTALSGGAAYEAPINAASLISLTPADNDGAPGERCDVLEFSLPPGAELISPTLTVLSLEASPREGETCTDYLDEVQTILDAKTSGIRIACQEAKHSFGAWVIASKPDSLSQEDAESILYQAFGDVTTLNGSWEFVLGLSTPSGQSLPSLEEQQPLIGELRQLRSLRVEKLVPKPGWLHIQSREIFPEPGETPDGAPLPAEHLVDEWFNFDASGGLQRTITRFLDMDGAVLFSQASGEDEAAYWAAADEPPALDNAFTDLAISAAKTGGRLSREPVNVDGQYVGERYVLLRDGVRWEAMYDADTGALRSLIVWELLPEGAKLAHSVLNQVIEAIPELPAEVAALLTPAP